MLRAQGAVFAANQSISYGEIVRRGKPGRKFTPDELAQLPIKPASERRLIGRKTNALDIPAKINGTARYGISGRRGHGLYPTKDSPVAQRGKICTAFHPLTPHYLLFIPSVMKNLPGFGSIDSTL